MPQVTDSPIFLWTAEYAVGVPRIDEEHQHLFALAGCLHKAMLEGKGKAILSHLLTGLADYTRYHFEHEEEWMARIRYPDLRQHREEHDTLRAKVREMHARLELGEVTMTIELMQLMMEWLKRHIATSDRRIAGYMRANGLSQ